MQIFLVHPPVGLRVALDAILEIQDIAIIKPELTYDFRCIEEARQIEFDSMMNLFEKPINNYGWYRKFEKKRF